MANAHFVLNIDKPHGRKTAELINSGIENIDTAANLKLIADEVTGGGVNLDAAGYLDLFGLPNAAAGAALYPLLQSMMAGSFTKTDLTDFDQGI